MASVRGAVIPGSFPDDDMFQPIAPGLSQYPSESYELVIGRATKLDTASKTVSVEADTAAPRSLAYDFLVLATGARSPESSMPWKSQGTHDDTLASMHSTADKVKAAKHIVVGGAGTTGVEVAGELGFAYGKDKEIVLVSGTQDILGGESFAGVAEKDLLSMNVAIRKGAKVTNVKAVDGGKTQVQLSGGESITTDLYLATVGQVPNAEYVDAALKTEKGYVSVDENLEVKGAKGVWALGDVISIGRASYLAMENQAPQVIKNVEAALKNQAQTPAKPMPFEMLAVTIGPKKGTGRMGMFKLPGFVISMTKGKTFVTEKLPKYAGGTYW